MIGLVIIEVSLDRWVIAGDLNLAARRVDLLEIRSRRNWIVPDVVGEKLAINGDFKTASFHLEGNFAGSRLDQQPREKQWSQKIIN